VAALEAWAREHRPALIVIDPVVAFLDEGLNAHRDADVRRALRALSDLAEEIGAAVVVVMHFNKGQGAQPLYRISGSIGFAGAARSVLVFGRRPESDERDPTRVLAVAKSSYAALSPAVEMTLAVRLGDAHPTLEWRGEVDGFRAEDLLRPAPDAGDRSAREEAGEFLVMALGDGDWHDSREVKQAARRDGIGDKPLRRARETLGVETDRRGQGSEHSSWWRLVHSCTPPAASVGTSGEGTSGREPESPYGDGDPGGIEPGSGFTRALVHIEGTSGPTGTTGDLFGDDPADHPRYGREPK
jgi:hypothetical protein